VWVVVIVECLALRFHRETYAVRIVHVLPQYRTACICFIQYVDAVAVIMITGCNAIYCFFNAATVVVILVRRKRCCFACFCDTDELVRTVPGIRIFAVRFAIAIRIIGKCFCTVFR
jgi:hypothetical protein